MDRELDLPVRSIVGLPGEPPWVKSSLSSYDSWLRAVEGDREGGISGDLDRVSEGCGLFRYSSSRSAEVFFLILPMDFSRSALRVSILSCSRFRRDSAELSL